MEEDEAELRNPFPSPPSHYNNYTTHNLNLMALLKERTVANGQDVVQVNQYDVLSDQSDVPEWPLMSLEKPRVDWILENGHFTVFGETWPVRLRPFVFVNLFMNVLWVDRSKKPSPPLRRWEERSSTLQTLA